MRLGKNQLATLRSLGPHLTCIVGDKTHKSLAAHGLVEALGADGDGFWVITPAGLCALADAIDAGLLPRLTRDNFRTRQEDAET